MLKNISRAKKAIILFHAVVFSVLGLFLYEFSRTAEDYFTFYGNIATKDVFISPEQATFYTFGAAANTKPGQLHNGSLPMTFRNEMWCHPIGNDDRGGHYLVDFRTSGVLEDFVFINTLPDVVKNNGTGLHWVDFGKADREAIRSHPGTYLKWAMDDLRPKVSSECYINALMTTQTPIFGLDKSMFVPDVGHFTYIVEGDDQQ